MIRARILLVLGLCSPSSLTAGLLVAASFATPSSVLGQDSVGELIERVQPEGTYLNSSQVNQWVSLNASKSITGKLVAFGEEGEILPRSAVEVSLVLSGKTVSRATTGSEGTFQFSNIAPGTYNFVAKSEYSFATFGIHVLPVGSGSPSSFEACASTVSSASVRQLLRDSWVPKESDAPVVFEKDPLAGKRIISSSPKVLLQNGDLLGQVSLPGIAISEQDLTGNVAHIFKGGQSIFAAPVGRDGKFRIIGLEAGVYDLAVVGEDGTAVIGFEAVGAKPIARHSSIGKTHFVSRQEMANVLSVELAAPSEFDLGPEEVPAELQEPGSLNGGFAPFMGGGFSTPGIAGGSGLGGGGLGGGGGGIGGGGLGGIGGLLGIAGLAVGVAALSDEDDFNPLQASPISP